MSECYMRELLSQGKDYELDIIHAMVTAVDRYLLAKSTKGRLFVTKSATMIKISHFFLSFFFLFFFHFWRLQVKNTYHARFYSNICTGSSIILNLFFDVGHSNTLSLLAFRGGHLFRFRSGGFKHRDHKINKNLKIRIKTLA